MRPNIAQSGKGQSGMNQREYKLRSVIFLFVLELAVLKFHELLHNTPSYFTGCFFQGRCNHNRGNWSSPARKFWVGDKPGEVVMARRYEEIIDILATFLHDICDSVVPGEYLQRVITVKLISLRFEKTSFKKL